VRPRIHFNSANAETSSEMLKNADIQRRRYGHLDWWVRVSLLTPEAAKILEDPEAFLRVSKLFKNDRSAMIAAAHGYVVKRSNQPKPYNLIIDLFRRSRARRAFAHALRFEQLGIPTAKAIASADLRRLGMPFASYLVTEEIPSAVHLGKWEGNKSDVIVSMAKLVADLHNAGFRHGDLKETNVLFDNAGRPHLIDMDSVRHYRRLPDSGAAKDLARLWKIRFRTCRYTRTDALRFLKAYCQNRHEPELRRWWSKVAAMHKARTTM
jgi:tRNA A-37 threonylcarbamoyl transferase component Bud32